jgi:hypothetical protein
VLALAANWQQARKLISCAWQQCTTLAAAVQLGHAVELMQHITDLAALTISQAA